MTSRPSRSVLALVAALALLVGACGSDDSDSAAPSTSTSVDRAPDDGAEDGSTEGYVEAAAAEFIAPTDPNDLELPEDSARCMAQGLVDAVGVVQLVDAGITPDQFATADSFTGLGLEAEEVDSDALAVAIDSCIDFRGLLGATAPSAFGCVIDGIDEAAFGRAIADEWTTGAPSNPIALMFESADPACAEGAFLAAGVEGGEIDETQAACIAAALDDEVAVGILLAANGGQELDEADAASADAAFAGCGVAR